MNMLQIRKFALLLLALCSLVLLSLTSINPKSSPDDLYQLKVSAANHMQRSMAFLIEQHGLQVDQAIDRNHTGMIGPEITPFTTTLGPLEIKRTTTNTDFAAVAVQLLWDAGVRSGDVVAIGISGSFPALGLAVRSAAHVMNVDVISIASFGSSTYGATDPSWTWVDMEQALVAGNLLDNSSIAASEGGNFDHFDNPLFPEASKLARDAARRNGILLIDRETFEESVAERMELYQSEAGSRRISAFINIGGAEVNIGTSDAGYTIRGGLVSSFPHIPENAQGVMSKMAIKGIPIIHFLNVKDFCFRYGIAFDPLPLPAPGESEVYAFKTRNWLHPTLFLVFLVLVICFIIWDRKISSRHMMVFLVFSLFVCALPSGYAAVPQYFNPDSIEFEKIQTPGVSNTIVEDAMGFIWVGTDVGLWRYDGYTFKNYSHVIPERIDMGMFQDSRGILWIGTESGLIAFDPIAGERRTFRHNPEDEKSISDHVFQYKKHAFCEDSQGFLWIATDNGLNRFDHVSGTFESFDSQNVGFIDNYVTAIISSQDGMLWVATFEGLQKFDPLTRRIVQYVPGAPKNMYSLCEDSLGNLWIGSYLDGVFRLDAATQKIEKCFPSPEHSDSDVSSMITFLMIPRLTPRILWIATFDGGLALMDIGTKEVHRFVFGTGCNERSGLSGNTLAHMMQDRMGAVYVLNEHGFLNRVDPEARRFLTHTSSVIQSSGPMASAYSVWPDKLGNIWMVNGTDALGLFDYDDGIFKNYMDLPIQVDNIAASDCDGSMWLSGDGVIVQFDPKKREVIDEISLKGLRIFGINDCLDRDVLWFGSADSGLIQVNKRTHEVTYISIPTPEGDGMTSSVMRLVLRQDTDGTIWISTFGIGLQKFDPKTKQIVATYTPKGRISGNPSALFVDSIGNYWVSFQNDGPALFDPSTGMFTPFEQISDGTLWPARGSTGMLEDNEGNLWISGNGSGEIVRFNPHTKDVRIYTQTNGVAPGTSDTLNWHPVIGEDGSFWFSGMGGVTQFYPELVSDNLYKPPVYITAVFQDGQPLDMQNIDECIMLPADKNYFEFEAVALNYRMTSSNQYRYRLVGRDENWVNVGTQRSGYYSGLEEGLYVLEVLGTNDDGIGSLKPARLRFCVMPHIPEDVIAIEHRMLLRQERLGLDHNENNLMFEILPSDHDILGPTEFMYMLDGYDTHWIPAENHRFVNYRRLDSGVYVMKLRDAAAGTQFETTILIHPVFYRSWWFIGGMMIVVFLIIFGFLLQKTRHLRKEKVEFDRNRQREIVLNQEKHEALMNRYEAIADRERALDALKQSELRYRDLLATMSEGFIVLDSTLHISYANQRFCEMSDYTMEELLQIEFSKLICEEHRDERMEILRKLCEGKNIATELTLLCRNNKYVTVLVSSKPVLDSTGLFKEGYAVITDVTRLKDTEEQLRTREREILEEKGDLEEMNTTLKVLLEKRNEDLNMIRNQLWSNLQDLIVPFVEQLGATELDSNQRLLLELIESNLEQINSSFLQQLGMKCVGLTQMEANVVACIRNGCETKEIADMFNISERTVEFHRAGIRRKLGLKGKQINLHTYLRSLP